MAALSYIIRPCPACTRNASRYATGMRVHIAADGRDFARRAADIVCELVRRRPDAVIGLPSGKTPLPLYAELARRARDGQVDFRSVSSFAIDELHGLPPYHPATNATYFRSLLTEHMPLRAFHVIDSEATDPPAECARFLQLIDKAGGLDLALLGIGLNGHIGFNEPGSPSDSRARRVPLAEMTRAEYAQLFGSVQATPTYGLTLGIADLLEAREILLLATGAMKAAILAQALEGPVTEELPASALQKHHALTVLIDSDAASHLHKP